MNTANTIFSFLILTSTLISCTHHEMGVEEKEKLLQSFFYERKVDLSTLNPENIASYMQILKEEKAVLKHVIAHQTGFFNNFDVVKGVVGIWFGTKWFFSGTTGFLLMLTYDNVQPTQKILVKHPFILSITGMFAIFSLWLLKISAANLYRGWYKKEHATKNLAKIDELLAQLEDIQ